MAKARIFISHSTYDPPGNAAAGIASPQEAAAAVEHARLALEIRDKLKSALDAAGHAVLLDKDGLELGDRWRSVLNLWIGGCDAAVLLLSQKALQSTYVAYEASILSHRSALPGSKFQLIPVFIPPVAAPAVDNSPLKSANPTEIQARVDSATTADTIVAAVVAKLAQFDRGESPIEKQVQHLSNLLARVPDNILRAEADALGVDIAEWAAGDTLHRTLALKMIGAGLSGTRQTLRKIRAWLAVDEAERDRVLDDMLWLIGSSWVDYRAVERIPALARSSRPIGSNAAKPLTARMYVLRASDLLPRDTWKVVEVNETSGAFDDDELRKQWAATVREGLKAAIPTKSDQKLASWLATRAQFQEPVFVALPFHGISDSLLEHLKSLFPTVTLFLLAGESEPSQLFVEKTAAEWLDPRLQPDDEMRFCGDYHAHHDFHFPKADEE